MPDTEVGAAVEKTAEGTPAKATWGRPAATASDSAATVHFWGVQPNGLVIKSLVVKGGPSDVRVTPNGSGPYDVPVTGLTNGARYSFTVEVCNNTTCSTSDSSGAVVPFGAPLFTAPTISVSDVHVSVNWSAVDWNGAPVGSATLRVNGGACSKDWDGSGSSSCSFDGSAGTSYAATMTAKSAGGATTHTSASVTAQDPVRDRNAYDNYGSAIEGFAMCLGNPDRPESVPGGTARQTFTVPAGMVSITSALVQIDTVSGITGSMTVSVNGQQRASSSAATGGDVTFDFADVAVSGGDQVSVSITFSGHGKGGGKIGTVYTAGSPGGRFSTSNTCPDGAPSVSRSPAGLRMVVHGTGR